MKGSSVRWILTAIGLVFVVAGTLPFSMATSVAGPGWPRVGGFLSMAIGLAVIQGFYPPVDRWGSRAGLFFLIGLAVLPRIFLLPAPVSDDVHRYRWEGRLVLNSENPYKAPADASIYEQYRDADWEKMNHKDRVTVYPPLAQGLFAAMVAGERFLPNEVIEKGIFIACDLGVFALVLLLLRRRRLPPCFSLLYALNPVVLVSFAGEAHYDAVLVLALVGAVLALEVGRARISWILLAVSIQIKLISAVLVSIWLKRRVWRGMGIAVAILLLTWFPFGDGLVDWIRALYAFGGESSFFGLIPWLFRSLGIPESSAAPTGAVLCVLALAAILWQGGSPATMTRRIIGAMLVCGPILHFWYLTWLIPFLALRPSLSWFWLCAGQAFYFLVWEVWMFYFFPWNESICNTFFVCPL